MQNTTTPPPHSGLGITSFVTSLAAGLVLLILLGLAAALESDSGSTPAAVLGIFLWLTAIAQMFALGLGIAALVQAGHNKLFGVLGTVFASCALVFTLILLLLGAALEA